MYTLQILLGALGGIVSVQVFTYLGHRLAHWPGSGKLFRSHMYHHSKAYPPSRYESVSYVENVAGSFVWPFVALFFAVATIMFLILPVWVFVGYFVAAAIASLASDYIHDSFHIVDHPLRRMPFYSRLTALHRIHHSNVKKNLGIYTFWVDRAVGSFSDRE